MLCALLRVVLWSFCLVEFYKVHYRFCAAAVVRHNGSDQAVVNDRGCFDIQEIVEETRLTPSSPTSCQSFDVMVPLLQLFVIAEMFRSSQPVLTVKRASKFFSKFKPHSHRTRVLASRFRILCGCGG
jgi:hypothetical protein